MSFDSISLSRLLFNFLLNLRLGWTFFHMKEIVSVSISSILRCFLGRNAPTPGEFIGVNMLLYDIRDVGCRFYTFVWTLTYSIESLAKAGKELVVFDRPNPLGRKVEGCPLNFDTGLVGKLLPGQIFTIPQR
jgi:uncharacterized protein YbbC (DUF1343 family)